MSSIVKSTSAVRPELKSGTRLVWDLPVRIAHWALVIGVAGAWATHYAGTEWFPWHRRCGYTVLVVAVFRIVWGFLGTRHARFASFLRGPREILAYLRSGAVRRGLGHNPLGALGVVAMLLLLALQGLTGLFANDEIASTGPLFGWVTQQTSNRITSLHHLNSEALLVLVGVHLVAVLWHALVRREPLVQAMVTGRRDAREVPAGEEIVNSRVPRALVVLVLLIVALVLAIRSAPEAAISLF